jgi:predicted DNA repair protein MutK
VGTVALLLVSGGIFIHNIHFVHDSLPDLPAMLNELVVGLVMGCLVVVFVKLFKKFIP